jgi:ABC-type nitrate/sulfonate/bicarbonate transport system substrate-binding protein
MQVRPGFLLLISLILLGLDDWATAEKIRVASSSPSLTARLPHMVAHEEGFFTREGLEVESIVVRNDAIILAALTAGEFTFVETGAPAAVAAIAKGLPSVIIGGFRSRLDYVLMGRKGLSTTKDLKGAKIGVTGAGGLSEAVAIAAMKKLGFQRDKDYAMLYVGNSPLRMIALEQGRVDASIFSPQQQIVLVSKGYPMLTDVGRLLPEVPALVLSAMREKVKSNPEQAVRFLRAMHQAMNLIRNDPDRALEAARKQKYSGDFKTEREALKYYYDAYSIGFGAANVESLIELSGLKTAMKPAEFFDPNLAGKAQR